MALLGIAIVLTLNLVLINPVACSRNHTALSSIVFTHIEPPDDDVHSEYYYGRCVVEKTLVAHHRWNFTELKGKMIVRGWLDLNVEPSCVYIRAKSQFGDFVRYHATKFNICVCRLVYSFSGIKWTYIYYEWYIPVEILRGIDWDLYFYSSNSKDFPQ